MSQNVESMRRPHRVRRMRSGANPKQYTRKPRRRAK